jgi:hypothetical protein
MKEIVSSLRIERGLGGVRAALLASNIAFKNEIAEACTWAWGQPYTSIGIRTAIWPYQVHPDLAANASDGRVRRGVTGGDTVYEAVSTAMSQEVDAVDYSRYRRMNGTVGSLNQAANPKVVAAIALVHNVYNRRSSGTSACSQGNMVSYIEIPTTQIGAPYMHPLHASAYSVTTTLGSSSVYCLALLSGTYGAQWLSQSYLSPFLRIESGPDRGIYRIQSYNTATRYAYLQHLDGTKFVAQASGAVAASLAYRTAFFNEVGVIPMSTGQVSFDGKYEAGESRASYIYRLHFEKSGSPSPANEAQRGSYWFSLRQYAWGTGVAGTDLEDNGSADCSYLQVSDMEWNVGSFFGVKCSMAINNQSACQGYALDRTRQRLWMLFGDGTKGSVGYWNYKSPESFREVITTSGYTPNCSLTTPTQFGAGGNPRFMSIGSDDSIYVVHQHATDPTLAGWYRIPSDLSAAQFVSGASVGLNLTADRQGPAPIDSTRARTGTTGDVTTTVGGSVQSASGSFTASDKGRAIKVTGTTDAGTYLISVVNSATDVTVTQLNGTAVSFTGGSGGTFQIGDRQYLFAYSNTAWNAGKMHYFESLAWGTLLTINVSMTNGAASYNGGTQGDQPSACIDPINGNVFWYSTDGVKHINKFVVATGLVEQRPFSDLAVQVPGSSSNPTAPTTIYTMAVNTHASFRELWLGTDQGHYRLNPDTFSAQLKRFWGDGAGTYAEADGNRHLDGSDASYIPTKKVRGYQFGIDGHAYAAQTEAALGGWVAQMHYNREADCWFPMDPVRNGAARTYCGSTSGYFSTFFVDPYGGGFMINMPGRVATQSSGAYRWVGNTFSVGVHYQWNGTSWFPKEVVRGQLPDDQAGCLTKPLHSTLESLLNGVKVRFTSSGSVGGENGEFLGRIAQVGTDRTDGGVTLGANTFAGSGFNALSFVEGSAGRYFLRIVDSDALDKGVYVITGVTNDNLVTLSKLNGVAWTATETHGTLTYSVWDLGAGASVGPEVCSVLANVGFAKDNTQDITGVYADFFMAKTLLSEQAEALKFCTDVLPIKGGASPQVYKDAYTTGVSPLPAMGAHVALGSALSNGTQALDGLYVRSLNNTANRANLMGCSGGGGDLLVSYSEGDALTVDLGADVEVGAIIARCGFPAGYGSTFVECYAMDPRSSGARGRIFNWYMAPDGTAPAASSVVRCSGSSNINGTTGTRTLTTTADFLGAATGVTGTDGATVSGGNVFGSAAGKFSTTEVGMILKVTTGVDSGNYRIMSIASDGSSVTIRNLDQTTKAFSSTGSGIAFEVRNGVREEDLLCIPSLASPTHRLVVELISNDAKTATVRLGQNATITSQNWECVKPTWKHVKRVSSGNPTPPETSNNGSFCCCDGKEGLLTVPDVKVVTDLSDLPTARRRGRWWKLQTVTKSSAYSNYAPQIFWDQFEFYDTNGKRIGLCKYNRVDAVISQPQFLAAQVSRADFVQATDAAVGGSFNGLATLGGTDGDVVTLGGGNKFLGFQVRPKGVGGTAAGASNVFTAGGSDPQFVASCDVGRLLQILSGPNAGIYRVASSPAANQAALVSPAGNAVTLNVDAGPTAFTLHEGFNVGTVNPDCIVFTTGGNQPGLTELTLKTVSDDLTSFTVNEKQYESLSGQNWEIRRRGIETSAAAGVDATLSARVVFAENMYPYQSGDIAQDPSGYVKCWPADVGGTTGTGFSTTGGNATVTGSAGFFCADDVGRILLITTGSNRGAYFITSVTGNDVTLNDVDTDVAATLVVDAAMSVKIQGERRFRLSRYTVCVRS